MSDQANELRRLVQEQHSPPPGARPSLIAVTGGKGGVGTTTVAIHLAAALARGSDRVLLVDADPDRSDVASLCGLTACQQRTEPAAGQTLARQIVPGPDGILILPGATRAPGQSPADRSASGWIHELRHADTPLDHVVVDTGNGTSQPVKRLWEAADLVLLVTTLELPSVLDAYASIKTLADRNNPPPIHALVTRADEPALAYDVHGRLARAVWRFLGFHLDSAGYLPTCRGPLGEVDARPYDQLARVLRAALCSTVRRPSQKGTGSVASKGVSVQKESMATVSVPFCDEPPTFCPEEVKE